MPVAGAFSETAAAVAAAISIRIEPSPPNEVRVLLEEPNGTLLRVGCVVDDTPPHRIAFQLFSPALDSSAYGDRSIQRDGRSVHVRDLGGDGPLLLLWHGAGCDVSVWEAMVPYLSAFRVVAQDLPGRGVSPLVRFSVSEAIADGQAVVAELGLGEPLLVGHSMGGWAGLHYAATTTCGALVCLDGPTSLDFAAMGLDVEHHACVADPPDVALDLQSLSCPTMVVLCRGRSKRQEEGMLPFRVGLSDHLTVNHPQIRVEWRAADHLLVLSQAKRTADLVSQFMLNGTD